MFHEAVLDEILQERVVSSRGRRNYRGLKRKMSNYHIRPCSRPLPHKLDIEKHIKLLM
jgi:hypothetical protein